MADVGTPGPVVTAAGPNTVTDENDLTQSLTGPLETATGDADGCSC